MLIFLEQKNHDLISFPKKIQEIEDPILSQMKHIIYQKDQLIFQLKSENNHLYQELHDLKENYGKDKHNDEEIIKNLQIETIQLKAKLDEIDSHKNQDKINNFDGAVEQITKKMNEKLNKLKEELENQKKKINELIKENIQLKEKINNQNIQQDNMIIKVFYDFFFYLF